jgi:ParB family chromosome partitioning protein
LSSTTLTVVTDPDQNPDTAPSAGDRSRPADAAYMHPDDVLIAENVRKTFDLADHLDEIASIREFGVGLPIRAERDPDGTIHAIDGQLRVLIAREVGLEEIPVWILDTPTGVDDRERRIARTLTQINLNDRRVPLSQRDRAAGVAQMLDLGASVTRVAKGLQTNRAEIKKTAAIGRSATAQDLLGGHQFGLDQLAVVAEYENLGDTDAVERLSRAARYNFSYTRNQIESERAETRDLLQAALPWAAYGFGVLTHEPDTSSADPTYIPAEILADSDGNPVSETSILTDATPWVVYLTVEENALLVDTTSGEIVDDDAVDWNTDGDPEATPADGYRHADTVEYRDGGPRTTTCPPHDCPAVACTGSPTRPPRSPSTRGWPPNKRSPPGKPRPGSGGWCASSTGAASPPRTAVSTCCPSWSPKPPRPPAPRRSWPALAPTVWTRSNSRS